MNFWLIFLNLQQREIDFHLSFSLMYHFFLSRKKVVDFGPVVFQQNFESQPNWDILHLSLMKIDTTPEDYLPLYGSVEQKSSL